MDYKLLKPRKTLNKAFLKVKPNRSEIEEFKTNLTYLLDNINHKESEEFHKNLVIEFLKKTYYDPNHFVNTKGRKDLVIHTGNKATTPVGVIIEAKSPTNRAEMVSTYNLNVKAFQELVLYYLRERITGNNIEIKHLIITNINEWFIFDAMVFDRLFAQNKGFVKQFQDFENRRLADISTDFFYKQVAEPFIADIKQSIEFTHFHIREYEKPLRNNNKTDDNKLIALFKLLSPAHLLKLPFVNDSNTLDKRFYRELLHIIGLEETKEGSKKVISRKKKEERNPGSLLENTIIQLDSLDKISRFDNPSQFGKNLDERLFNVGLELTITWINRILFLKLLEAQLITYHKGDKSYEFLNSNKIRDYDALNKLFFQVLAKHYSERTELVQKAFGKVPYLNSSLFEPNEMEHKMLFISNLEGGYKTPIHSDTVLKDEKGKRRTGNIDPLNYLFEFLDAYDFTSEGSENIQEENKTLINASVLGLIFEKINGYKDGSFFTPGFITMYMCRETIRKAVVQKFNDALSPPLERGAGGVSLRDRQRGVSLHDDSRGVSLHDRPKRVPRRTIIPYNPKLKEYARNLRNQSTKSEVLLWTQLKGKFMDKYDFHRQKPLDNYIADFFCYELKLVIEIDGATHEFEETQKKDLKKERRLNEIGLNVLRFPDSDIFEQLSAVIDTISLYVNGYEKGDLSAFAYPDTPLNPLSRGDFALPTTPLMGKPTPPLKSGAKDVYTPPLERGQGGVLLHDESVGVFKTLDDIYENIGDDRPFTRQQANNIINDLKICDPAVGSGHFLVSALNEIISIKNDLKILQDRQGRRLKEYHVEVVNDELIVTDEEGELFEYSPNSRESQRVQEALFHEKQTIIENCLFGVDINPNSVKICRLRLWIELLKNAYYKIPPLERGQGGVSLHGAPGGVLETLPNIDINIKCGNSLVSRFPLDADLSKALRSSKWSIESYRNAVQTYRQAHNKEEKRQMERLMADIKSDFRSEIAQNDPKVKRLTRLKGELFTLTNQTMLFEQTKKEKALWKKKVAKHTADIGKLEAEIEEIKNNKIYENAFEWRFEFPEVLNGDGNFVGFDAVIGNPPYVVVHDDYLAKQYHTGKCYDLYCYFFELGAKILLEHGTLSFITPSLFIKGLKYKSLQDFLLTEVSELKIDEKGDNVFEEVSMPTAITFFSKTKNQDKLKWRDLFVSNPITKKLKSGNKLLGEISKIQRGLEIGKKKTTQVETDYKLITGTDIEKYNVKTIRFITHDIYKDYIKEDLDFFEKERILIRETGSQITCVYIDYKLLSTRSLYSIIPDKEVNPKFLLAILCSKLVQYYYTLEFKADTDVFPKIRIAQVKKIPIKIIDKSSQKPFIELINRILEEKELDKDTTHLESQIDQLVYQLYELTEEEIKIVEGAVG